MATKKAVLVVFDLVAALFFVSFFGGFVEGTADDVSVFDAEGEGCLVVCFDFVVPVGLEVLDTSEDFVGREKCGDDDEVVECVGLCGHLISPI